jgi:GntR family transcriptional regulator / MocR family aminotransferase
MTTERRARTPATVIPLISVDRRARPPLHQQVYDGLRSAITVGRLAGGQQIPSTRDLSKDLGVSRIPVLSAYSQLIAEGYLETRAGAGTYVCKSLPEQSTSCHSPAITEHATRPSFRRASKRAEALPSLTNAPWVNARGAFSLGQLALDEFPLTLWTRLVSRTAKNAKISSLSYGQPHGRYDLRRAIASYLGSARAVRCSPEQILIVSGSQQALQIAAWSLLDPGDSIWIEDPAYRLARRVFELAGAKLVPVPVDEEGLHVEQGKQKDPYARAAFVTPSHQLPLGVTMSASRRLQLLEWAQQHGSWIIEDDYDSEFRYESRPIASLQGLDTDKRVIYIGTFSKVLLPSIRVGYMVVPEDMVDRFVTVRQTMDICPADLQQAVLAEFIDEGHFARHIRQMRLIYGERRAALAESLETLLSDELELHGDEAGMHLTVTLKKPGNDREIALRAAKQDLWLWPLSPAYQHLKPRHGFILGFGGVPASQMPRAARLLREVLRES